jgi:hypothetical protein
MSRPAVPSSAGKIRCAGQFVPFAAARAAPNAARRRCIACNGVSPGRISEEDFFGPESIGVANFSATAEIAVIGGAGSGVVGRSANRALGERASRPWRSSLVPVLRRRIGLCPSSRLSQSRRASSEIATPSPRNAVASTSTESPARRSRSSSSRCGSRCTVFRSRSWRARAAKSASVGGEVGAGWWLDCVGAVVMWERYVERARSAMGVVLDQSKPKGLDVGVLTSWFLLIFPHRCGLRKASFAVMVFVLLAAVSFRERLFCGSGLVVNSEASSCRQVGDQGVFANLGGARC